MNHRDSTALEIVTHAARADWGDNQFCGHSVARELAGNIGTWSAISLAVGHRVLSRDEEAMLDDLAICSLAADPRIWPLKIVRVLSAYGSAAHAFAGAHLSLEDARVGPWQTAAAARLLCEVRAEADRIGMDAAVSRVLNEKKPLPGFGVPFRGRDERLVALEERMTGRGGPHWCTLQDLASAVRARKSLEANIVCGFAAVTLDLGFAPEHMSALTMMIPGPQFLANAVEGAAQKPALLQQLPGELVAYTGHPPRASGRRAR